MRLLERILSILVNLCLGDNIKERLIEEWLDRDREKEITFLVKGPRANLASATETLKQYDDVILV